MASRESIQITRLIGSKLQRLLTVAERYSKIALRIGNQPGILIEHQGIVFGIPASYIGQQSAFQRGNLAAIHRDRFADEITRFFREILSCLRDSVHCDEDVGVSGVVANRLFQRLPLLLPLFLTL